MDNEKVSGICELNNWDIEAYKYGINKTFVKKRIIIMIVTFVILVLYSLYRYLERDYSGAIAMLIIEGFILITQIISIILIKNNILNKIEKEVSTVTIIFYDEYFHVIIENNMGSTNMKYMYKDFTKLIKSNKYLVLCRNNQIIPLNINSIKTDNIEVLVEKIQKQIIK